MKNKKYIISNRISFIFFALYLLTYILLPIVAGSAKYLMFLITPCIFLFSLIINLLIKHDKLKSEDVNKAAKIIVALNLLLNGLSSSAASIRVGTRCLNEYEIKKYPSIVPTWLFAVMFSTLLGNFVFYILLVSVIEYNVSAKLLLIFSIISVIFLLLAQISSTFTLYYSNGKKETIRFWRNTIIVFSVLVMIGVILFTPLIKSEIKNHKEKEELQRHIENIEETIKDNIPTASQ